MTRSHGDRSRSEYNVWASMKQRCSNPNYREYHLYGGRGISYDPSWERYEGFIKDMGYKPDPLFQIDRIDNDGPYSKENCRWVSAKENCRNRRNTRITKYLGREQSVIGWCEELALPYKAIRARILRGWPPEKAFTFEKGRRLKCPKTSETG